MDYCFSFSAMPDGRWLATDPAAGVAYKLSRHAMLLLSALQSTESREAAFAGYVEATASQLDPVGFDRAVEQVLGDLRRQARPPRRQLAVSWTLLSHRWVDAAARPLQALADYRMFVLNLALSLVLFALLFARLGMPALPNTAGAVGAFMGLLSLSALFHELGHASAVKRSGHAVGSFGFGIYWIYPVFYTELFCLDALKVAERLRINLAGVHFQLMFACLLGACALLAGWPVAGLMAELIMLFTLFQLLPVGRSDGYWVLRDLSDGWGAGATRLADLLTAALTLTLVVFMFRVSVLPLAIRLAHVGGAAEVAVLLLRPSSLLVLAQVVMIAMGARSLLLRLTGVRRRSHAA